MKPLFLGLALAAAALTFGAVVYVSEVDAQLGCGIAPIPPIPPIGTTKCTPVCVCDSNGRNCKWQFECR